MALIDPANTTLWVPSGLRKFKLNLFERIGQSIKARGGSVIRGDIAALAALPDTVTPIVGCNPELTGLIAEWKARGRTRLQWDRGYARRVFATWLPPAASIEQSFYRWHVDAFQLRSVGAFPDDRWRSLNIPLQPWKKNGRHVVIAAPTPNYTAFHQLGDWLDRTMRYLSKVTDRQIVVRQKDSKRPLQFDLEGAHAIVGNGSIAMVEAAILGCPVFDVATSAAALVGLTDLSLIERPIYPDRQPWANALAYSQVNETEMVDGTLWRLLAR